jgi:hypothetical protein
MIKITPLMRVALSHDPYAVSVADSGHVAVLGFRSGKGSLISPDFKTVHSFGVSDKHKSASLSPGGSLLAIADGDGLAILDTSTLAPKHRLNGSFLACLFAREALLWTCSQVDGDTANLEVWDAKSWHRVAGAQIADPFGESMFLLVPGPKPNSVAVWAAAGQNGQCLFWASLEEGAIDTTQFQGIRDCALPSFSPNGEEFLVNTATALRRYGYPEGPLHGELSELDDKDNALDNWVAYADARHAVATTQNGAMLAIDVAQMAVKDEVAIAGHGLPHFLLPYPGGKLLTVYRADGTHVLVWQM